MSCHGIAGLLYLRRHDIDLALERIDLPFHVKLQIDHTALNRLR